MFTLYISLWYRVQNVNAWVMWLYCRRADVVILWLYYFYLFSFVHIVHACICRSVLRTEFDLYWHFPLINWSPEKTFRMIWCNARMTVAFIVIPEIDLKTISISIHLELCVTAVIFNDNAVQCYAMLWYAVHTANSVYCAGCVSKCVHSWKRNQAPCMTNKQSDCPNEFVLKIGTQIQNEAVISCIINMFIYIN